MIKEWKARKRYVDYFNMHYREVTHNTDSLIICEINLDETMFTFVLAIPKYGAIRTEIISDVYRYSYRLINYIPGEKITIHNFEVAYAED